jgi:IS4 transposase
MQFAHIKAYRKDANTKDIILVANLTDADGKPLIATDDTNDIEIHFSQEGLQKLIREELPSDEKRIQELLDRIHKARTDRVLSVEKIDDEIQKIMDDAKKDFDACQDKLDIAKVSAIYRVRQKALGDRRLLSKFAMHEESELRLYLAMLKNPSK